MCKCIWFPEAFSTLATKHGQEAHSIHNVSIALNNTPLTSTSLQSAAGSADTYLHVQRLELKFAVAQKDFFLSPVMLTTVHIQ